MTRRAESPGRTRARPAVLAAVALIVVAGIILFVLGKPITRASPAPQASPSSSSAVASAVAALLRQGTPDTATRPSTSVVLRMPRPGAGVLEINLRTHHPIRCCLLTLSVESVSNPAATP